MALELHEANQIADVAMRHAKSLNLKVCVAVCDAGGRLVSFQRMDGAIWAAVYGCQGKAAASAAFGRASGDLTERADHPTFRGIVAADGGHMILGRGAVPIVRDGGRRRALSGDCAHRSAAGRRGAPFGVTRPSLRSSTIMAGSRPAASPQPAATFQARATSGGRDS